MKKVLKLIVIIGVAVIIIYFIFHPLVYELDYFREVGIGKAHTYDAVLKNKGEPLKLQQEEDGNWNVYYDGMIIKYGNRLKTGRIKCVTITGKQYRFGLQDIGIGTSRRKIERVYKNVKKISDMPDDEFGVIDGGTWVWFKFDRDNNVSQIDLTTDI